MSQIKVDTITDELGTGAPNFPYGAEGIGGGFTYAAVSGATQDLDLDNGNFFNVGTTTADTTVTFSNVGTEASWRYSFKAGGVSNAWDISGATLIKFAWVAQYNTSHRSIFMSADGTRLYGVGTGGDEVMQYSLGTAWDIGTLAFNKFLDISAQETDPNGISFKPDGTKMFVTGHSGDDVNEYHLSTAWDISTATYDSVFSVSAQTTSPRGMFFKPDGLKMYIVDAATAALSVRLYNLSTAWDVSTASYSNSSPTYSAQETAPDNVFIGNDGLKMYVSGASGVHEFDLSTAWDVSTASFNQSLGNSVLAENAPAIFFKPDGERLYILGTADSLAEYHLSTPYSLTFPAAVENPPLKYFAKNDRVTYEFFTADSGTTVTLIGETIL